MKLGRSTISETLVKARAALAESERKIADLQGQRDGVLLADDDLSRVQEIDAAIVAEQRACVIHTDRIAALTVQAERERVDGLERARAADIAVANKLLGGRLDCAKAVQAALNALGEAIGRLYSNRDAILKNWPEGLPRPRGDDLKVALDKEIAWTLFSAGKIPASGSLNVPRGLEVLSIQSVVATVASEHNALIERLKSLPFEREEAA